MMFTRKCSLCATYYGDGPGEGHNYDKCVAILENRAASQWAASVRTQTALREARRIQVQDWWKESSACTGSCARCGRTLCGARLSDEDHGRCLDDVAETMDGRFMHPACYDGFIVGDSVGGRRERAAKREFNAVDLHAKTAAEIFGVPVSRVTAEMRRAGKIVNFRDLYGFGHRSRPFYPAAEATNNCG